MNKIRPLRRKFFWYPLLMAVLFPAGLHAQFLTIDTTFYSPALKQDRNITVFLPDDYYKDQDRQYSTIYYLHGWGGDHTSLNAALYRLNLLLQSGEINPVILVCADHSALPFGSGVYVNSTLTGNFEDYAAYDVVDWVESSFRAIPEKNARALFGQSLGAYGAFWLSIQHKDRFRAISAHAGQVNNDFWLPAVRMMVIFENGAPPYYYDFYAYTADDPILIPGFFSRSMFLAASGFSPDENSQQTYINPRIVDYPFDEWGNLIDSVCNKWKNYDIAHKIQELMPADSVSILFGCGESDETLAYFPNLRLTDSLNQYNLSYEFYSHKGGHSMPDVYLVRSMLFFDSLLMHPGTVTAMQRVRTDVGAEVKAFPNPLTGSTSIRLLPGEDAAVVELFAIDGSRVSTEAVIAEVDHQLLSIRFHPGLRGMYLLRFRSAQRTACVKLMLN